MTTAILSLKNVNAGYAEGQVLFDIDLSVTANSRVAILGHNGWGKTTLARTISGFITPTRGQVVLNGKTISGAPPHAIANSGIALVPQGREVFASLTVEETLRLAARKVDDGSHWKEAYDLFPRLFERAHQYAGNLSGGEQQMLAIGRALVRRPQVLILDEPTEGLAPRIVDTVCQSLQNHTQGITIVLLEQRVSFAEALCDRLIWMNGRGLLSDNPASPCSISP